MDDFDYLTDEQKRLLFDIVEASRRANDTFMMIRTMQKERLQHGGFDGGTCDMAYADISVLRDLGLFTIVSNDRHGAFHFAVAPRGYAVYEELYRRIGQPVEIVEHETLNYLNARGLHERHPTAMESWNLAAQLVWSKNADPKLSDVGHHCRVALQEFTESLLACMGLAPDEPNREKTRNRASQALHEARNRGHIGLTMESVLNALFEYWAAVYDLACKQEHAANREASPSDWDDARALVFQALFVMGEFDRLLGR